MVVVMPAPAAKAAAAAAAPAAAQVHAVTDEPAVYDDKRGRRQRRPRLISPLQQTRTIQKGGDTHELLHPRR
jgi:hypothetical protein